MSKIFITIVNFNGNKDTIKCLESLENVSKEDFELEVIVIDNASKEPLILSKNDYKNFTLHLLRTEENLGFSGGQNSGIKYALSKDADYIVILNNDVLLDNNFLVELFKTFKENSNCGIVSPKIYFAKGFEFHKDRYKNEDKGKVIWYAGGRTDFKNIIAYHLGVDEVDRGQYESLKETDFATGCCMMVKKEVFKKIGFFNEKYFLYYEDNDFSKRTINLGFKIYFQPKSYIWHFNAGSAGGSGSSLQDYYISRNRLLFGFKYASNRAKVALLRESIKILLSGRRWQKKGVGDYFLGKFGKGSYK